MDERDAQKRSPSHRGSGRMAGDMMPQDSEVAGQRTESQSDPLGLGGSPEEWGHPRASSHIPLPGHRIAAGHADKEVMAAAALTSLFSSHPPGHPVPEPTNRVWKESLSASYSSSTSGNWSWDTSDQSVPSTPSPPLNGDISKGFLLSSQGDDITEDSETTHFLFEDPIPRKRKNSMKVMFKCLWKNCETVLSSSSGIQRHVRTMHLGRNRDSDDSDGEEDFYYSEMEVNVDTLSEGLSSLAPTSPITPMAPPIFPDPPASEPARVTVQALLGFSSPLSQSAPSALCHIRTDHAYQASAPVSIPAASVFRPSDGETRLSWQSPPVGPSIQIRVPNVGDRRQPFQHATVTKSHTPATPTHKPFTGTRKPRGEAKKCRKVYGMEKKDMWCTACRWKKACQRFTD
ncbi:zinc finger protein 704-like [Megalops cyprinoides]|uniref:zinc finger protein 704-like n=1 Tax=Megalops cyprinoides TaxID=118141 RepID=UPI0018649734|nr:zinc finger protein 704-like [Megalops cyprinoides]